MGAGCEVLIKRGPDQAVALLRAGVVLCVEDGRLDVMFHGDESEEDGVPLSRIIKCAAAEDMALQVSLYLNLARCHLALPHSAATAAAYTERAVALASWAHQAGVGELQPHVTAVYLRAKAQLARKKYREALADAETCVSLDPNNKQAASLLKNIPVHQERARKKDRKLAKEVAAWVGEAMEDVEKGKDLDAIPEDDSW